MLWEMLLILEEAWSECHLRPEGFWAKYPVGSRVDCLGVLDSNSVTEGL